MSTEMTCLTRLEVGNGLELTYRAFVGWCVESKGIRYSLREAADYFRLVLLLEKSWEEVSGVVEAASVKHGVEEFPLHMVVVAALESSSEEWVRRGLDWVSVPRIYKEGEVQKAVTTLIGKKEFPQDIRQRARKFRDKGGW